MSERIQKHDNRTTIRGKLLTGASAVALAAYMSSTGIVEAADTGRPLIWLQASGQFDQLVDGQTTWIPEFVPGYQTGPFAGQFLGIQKEPKTGFDADASISFQPHDSDWMLSASFRIGRARQPGSALATQHESGFGRRGYDTHYSGLTHDNESHEIVDFQVGKDIGIGVTPWDMDSAIRAGIRIAQFHSRSDIDVSTEFPLSYNGTAFNDARTRISRKFAGLGPSISWDSSVSIAGIAQDGQLAIDWSATAALLFGRQTMTQKTDAYYQAAYRAGSGNVTIKQEAHPTRLRRKNVTVPDLGGSIGISYRWPTARVSLGYRADFFFNAIDGGIDTRKTENRGFFGPYASISVGIGD